MIDLCQRLGSSIKKTANKIYLPRFIMFVLNFKHDDLHKLDGINAQRIGYAKSMYKIQFGSLDSRYKVGESLDITSFMDKILKSYPLTQSIFHSLSAEKNLKIVGEPTQKTKRFLTKLHNSQNL